MTLLYRLDSGQLCLLIAQVLLMSHQGPHHEESKITLLLKLGENKVDLLDVKKKLAMDFVYLKGRRQQDFTMITIFLY